jgi:hypothetical protein
VVARCYAARSPAAEPFSVASSHPSVPDFDIYPAAIVAASSVVAVELLILAWLRHTFFQTSFARSLPITVGGAIIASPSAALGVAAGG